MAAATEAAIPVVEAQAAEDPKDLSETIAMPMDLAADSADDSDDDGSEPGYTIEIDGLEPLADGAEPRRGVSKLGIGKKSWTAAEDDILAEVVAKNGAQRWSMVAAQLPGRAGKQCRERCAPGSGDAHAGWLVMRACNTQTPRTAAALVRCRFGRARAAALAVARDE